MTIRTCSAALILALWYSSWFTSIGAAPMSGTLAILVRAYRESPSPARRGAVMAYIAGHPNDAALAHLALGIAEYDEKNYAAAIVQLKPLKGKLAQIGDYTAYYLAAARVESNDFEVTAADLAAARRNSPLNGKSWLPFLLLSACYYSMGCNLVLRINPHTADATLAKMDAFILGNQASFMLEPWIHPWLTDFLNVVYFSHLIFFPGVALYFYLVKEENAFRRLMMGFLTIMLLGITSYLLVPAVGPESFFASQYRSEER